ncbi:MAG: tRNA (adenosine(37)-N6)-threonylcarbamoyltransferase complex transferase subunit TsaD [Chitinivibrionales bacterium]|nr:tRNA (adenosine(37)-N6)-threonylcarbamoyltransferase complex transferase subunit TsaD [Chitinivibrionales bacterium]
MIILGIETSCDETSAALLDDETIIADEIYTQDIHSRYGGVVPEIASRAHLQKVGPLCRSVLDKGNMSVDKIDHLAVTDSPGLAGALLVGISYAQGIHIRHKIPVTGINHLEGHIQSIFLEHPSLSYPFLSLIISGGHTAIYRVDDFGSYYCLGETIDDAAGEAFDKVGTMLGFSYPAGRSIEQEANRAGEKKAVRFPVARLSTPGFDFSFSGLKTAVRNYLKGKDHEFIENHKDVICKGFQDAVIKSLVNQLSAASEQTGISRIVVAGGVACNGTLRKAIISRFGSTVFFPSPRFCTDNAAMIARAGLMRAKRNMVRYPRMAPSGGIGKVIQEISGNSKE